MKHFQISLLFVAFVLETSLGFMFTGLEPIEQKYESPAETDLSELNTGLDSGATSNIDLGGQTYGQQESGSASLADLGRSSSYKSSMFSSGEINGGYRSPSENLKSLEQAEEPDYGSLKSITNIPSGAMFALDPAKGGKSPLEFQSPYSKQPYSIVFRTQSVPVKIKQQHQTLPAPEIEYVRSQEEPHRVQHTVTRPIIQEVVEIIQPYRRVVQEIKPVIENVHTIVAKGEGRGGAGAGQQLGGGGGGQQLGGNNGAKGGIEAYGQAQGGYGGMARGFQGAQQQMYRRKGVMHQPGAGPQQVDYQPSKFSRSTSSRY